MNVESVMTRAVCSCYRDDTLNRAAELMWDKDCGFLPVLDEQRRLVGVVTDRDLCMGAYIQGVPLWAAPVSSVMSGGPWACSPEDDITEVERLMREKQIRRVPVINGKEELVGVVSLGDFARSSISRPARGRDDGVAVPLASICQPRQGSTLAAGSL